MSLSAFRDRFQPVLQAFLHEKAGETGMLTDDPFLRSLLAYPEKLLEDGKRIRPYVAWLMCQGKGEGVLRILAGLELFHAFALVHDDIMDRADTRRGVPTVHRFVAEALKRDKRENDADHAGMSQAILIGDILMNWSQSCFDQVVDGITDQDLSNARNVFRRMIDEVIIGQVMDVDLATRESVSDELIDTKMRLKTAGYTFTRPMQIGAALAGVTDPAVYQWCEQFGTAIGTAFQIHDDLIDLTESSEKTGKPVFGDLHERQHTIFTQYILKNGTEDQKTELHGLFGATLSESDRPRVASLFETSGAIVTGREEMERLFDEALKLLIDAPITQDARQKLCDLVEELKR